MDDDVKTLLESVEENILKRQQEKHLSGDDFNAFNTAQIGYEETRHSAIIAALLDPNGTFGQGIKPMQAFFRHAGLYNFAKLCNMDTYIYTEYHIIGRRMDIVISNKDICVVIENKTITVDHDQQLFDYHKWLDEQPQAHKALLYLTYEGDKACHYNGDDYIRISYRKTICDWLRECAGIPGCKKETAVFCNQYCDFITKTLLQEENKMSQDEWNKIIEEHFEAAEKITEKYEIVKKNFLQNFFNNWLNEQDGEIIPLKSYSEHPYEAFYLETGRKDLLIGFQFDCSGFRSFGYGLCWKSEEITLKMRDKLPELKFPNAEENGWKRSEWWPYWKSFDGKLKDPGNNPAYFQRNKNQAHQLLDTALNQVKVLLQKLPISVIE